MNTEAVAVRTPTELEEYQEGAEPWYIRRPELILSPLSFVAFLALWELVVRVFSVPVYVVPGPLAIAEALRLGLLVEPFAQASFWNHIGITLSEALLGFAIGSSIGVTTGAVLAQFRLLERTALPFIFALQCVPKVAIAPLLVIWFGFGMPSKVVVSALLAFFPVLVNSLAGLESVDRDRIDLMRSLAASRWQIFSMVRFPSALPFIFAGLDMAVIYSMLGAIVGEFVGAKAGLGVLLLQMNFQLYTQGVFAVFVVLATVGITLHLIVRAIWRRALFWAPMGDNVVGA